VAALVVLAAVAGLVVALHDRGGGSASVPASSVAVIDPQSNRVVGHVDVGNTPTRVVVGEGYVWVLNADDRTISQLAPPNGRLVRTFATEANPTDLATGFGSLWVGRDDPPGILRIDPASGLITKRIVLWSRPIVDPGPTHTGLPPGVDLATAFGSVWAAAHVGYTREFLARIDPGTGRLVAAIPGFHPGRMAASPDGLFTMQVGDLARVDVDENVLAWQELFRWKDTSLAADERWLWVAQGNSDVVWQIDGSTRKIERSIRVGRRPSAVATGFGSVWTANADGTVSRIDLRTLGTATISIGGVPHGIAVGEGRVWVTVG
jgi:hypothetical protein